MRSTLPRISSMPARSSLARARLICSRLRSPMLSHSSVLPLPFYEHDAMPRPEPLAQSVRSHDAANAASENQNRVRHARSLSGKVAAKKRLTGQRIFKYYVE